MTVVADRGFADCNLFKCLEEELGFGYVIRLPASYYVTSESGERRLASQWVGPAGRMRTLRNAQVTSPPRRESFTVCTVEQRGHRSRSRVRQSRMPRIWCARRTGRRQGVQVPRNEGVTEPRFSASCASVPARGQAKRR